MKTMSRPLVLAGASALAALTLAGYSWFTPANNTAGYASLVPAGYVMQEIAPETSAVPYWTAVEVVESVDRDWLEGLCQLFLRERPTLAEYTARQCFASVLHQSGVDRVQELGPGDLVYVPAPESTDEAIEEQLRRREMAQLQ